MRNEGKKDKFYLTILAQLNIAIIKLSPFLHNFFPFFIKQVFVKLMSLYKDVCIYLVNGIEFKNYFRLCPPIVHIC